MYYVEVLLQRLVDSEKDVEVLLQRSHEETIKGIIDTKRALERQVVGRKKETTGTCLDVPLAEVSIQLYSKFIHFYCLLSLSTLLSELVPLDWQL